MRSSPIDAAAVQRALQTAHLMTVSRHSRTNLSLDKIDNIARVLIALNLVATNAADLFAAREKLLAAKGAPAIADAEDAYGAAETTLAGALLALGFIHINPEATDDQSA